MSLSYADMHGWDACGLAAQYVLKATQLLQSMLEFAQIASVSDYTGGPSLPRAPFEMGFGLPIWYLLPLVQTGSAIASCSDNPPLSLPITNVDLSNGHSMRGVPLSVGSPPQNISFLPHNVLNNTWIYNASLPLCINETTTAQCLTIRGGTYDPLLSTSASDTLDVYGAGGSPSDTFRALGTHIWDSEWTTDTLRAGNTTLADFPIGMPGFDFGGIYDTQANIGLGRNSTLLNGLRESGRLSSRTYSFWWGVNSASAANSMDGQLVLGGYDAAKVTGPNITQKLLPAAVGCGSGMYLTITNMILGFPNGTKADMLAPSIISACIQLDWPTVASFRYEPFMERFQNFTGTARDTTPSGQPWEVLSYRLDEQYGGDLTLVLDGTSGFTLSNDILILPQEYLASDGASETNPSRPGILMSPTSNVNVNDVSLIGRPFFSAAYIMVDLDAGTWTMWQANATTDSRLVSVGENCAERPKVNTSPPTITPPGVVATNETTTHSNDTVEAPTESASAERASTGLQAGAIAGIAVGAVVASGLLAAALVICWLRRRRHTKRSASDTDIALTKYGHESEQLTPIWHEKPGESAQELPSGILAHELSVRERPTEVFGGHWDGQAVELPGTLTPRT